VAGAIADCYCKLIGDRAAGFSPRKRRAKCSLAGFERMAGVCTSQPRAVAWSANRLDVFVTGTDSALYHEAWDGSAWRPSLTGYENLGVVVSAFRAPPVLVAYDRHAA
jgi:hypothetical protein